MMDEVLEVDLNVYDLWERNSYLYPVGCGAFHSGLVLRSGNAPLTEITFGGHPYDMTGVFEHRPGSVPSAPDLAPRTTVAIGISRLSRREIAAVVASMSPLWKGCDYHMLQKNCNHFTSALSMRICNAPIPNWVNRLAYLGSLVECMVPLERIMGMPPTPQRVASADDDSNNDFEHQWDDNAFSLSTGEPVNLPSSSTERRRLLAEAAEKRL